MLQYPLHVMPIDDFLKLEPGTRCLEHQKLVREGKVVEWGGVSAGR